jgi:tetratricopeptide (TPR) repeat protein
MLQTMDGKPMGLFPALDSPDAAFQVCRDFLPRVEARFRTGAQGVDRFHPLTTNDTPGKFLYAKARQSALSSAASSVAFIGAGLLQAWSVTVGMNQAIFYILILGAFCLQSRAAQTERWVTDGRLALEHGQPIEAAKSYGRALEELKARGAPVKEMLTVELSLVTAYLEAGEVRNAEALVQEARPQIDRIPESRVTAEFHNACGSLLLQQGRLAEAEAKFQFASETLDRVHEKGIIRADVSHNLAAVEMRTGRFAKADRDSEVALRLWAANGEEDGDRYIRGLGSLATVQFLMGRQNDARLSLERAISDAERLYGPKHPVTAGLFESYAVVLTKMKRKKEARAALRDAAAARGAQPDKPVETSINARQAMALGAVSLGGK